MTDVLVVGAGVAGCAVARELASDHSVRVLDRAGVASGATGRSAGLVSPSLFYGDVPAVARYATEFFRAFDGTDGFQFTERPRIDFVADDAAEARATATRLSDSGFPVAYHTADELARRFDAIRPSHYVGGLVYEDTGWVDPYAYATTLQREAERHGATFETGRTVTGVLVEDSAVTGVETESGTVEAEVVVLAAGWRTPDLLPTGVEVPVRPYRTQCVVLDPDEPLADSFPLGRFADEHLYLRPEHNGDLLVGGAHELVDDPRRCSLDADESFRLQVAAFLPEVIEGFDRAGFVTGWAGVDAATPDARPIVDAVGPDGLVVATGFNGLGIVVSPVVGPVVRAILTGEPAPVPRSPFRATRFDSVDSSFALHSTSDV